MIRTRVAFLPTKNRFKLGLELEFMCAFAVAELGFAVSSRCSMQALLCTRAVSEPMVPNTDNSFSIDVIHSIHPFKRG
jgi:hypothetical protein